ncbi:MAG TPA: hypothetical protein DCW29_24855 [Janthinobacterium sp.]|nr:hypothetical protein [Janthinobacterium sp.]
MRLAGRGAAPLVPLLLVPLVLAMTGAGAQGAPATRAASAQEIASFDAFRRQGLGVDGGGPATFEIRREGGRWRVDASVDGLASRRLRGLCRMDRAAFHYDGRNWSASGAAAPLAWLAGAGACAAPAAPVRLVPGAPDATIAGLLEQQARLLLRARLLFAGNTACAALRSRDFTLTAIDYGVAGAGADALALYALVFHGGRGVARVWVKNTGRELSAWSVACAPA